MEFINIDFYLNEQSGHVCYPFLSLIGIMAEDFRVKKAHAYIFFGRWKKLNHALNSCNYFFVKFVCVPLPKLQVVFLTMLYRNLLDVQGNSKYAWLYFGIFHRDIYAYIKE